MKTPILLLSLLCAVPALAQEHPAAPAPAYVRAETVPGFEGWSGTAGPTLALGRPATLALAPASGQTFTPALNRPPEPGSYGGTFPLTIARPGTYRIALAPGAWIDVIRDGRRLRSTAHTHGPACSGLAKIVDFTLEPGTYQVQLSDVKGRTIKAMVIGG